MTSANKVHITAQKLQSEILRMQGLNPSKCRPLQFGLGGLEDAFPNASFPLAAVHEFIAPRAEDLAPTIGCVNGLLSTLLGSQGIIAWISSSRKLFPPSLKNFGLSPDKFIFIDLPSDRDVLWAMEEALKCCALTAVVGEVHELSFLVSRRLQLAVEQSQVTGFVIRTKFRNLATTACVSRWSVSSLPSVPLAIGGIDLPGIGFPRWRVELLRMRNGKSGVWEFQWMNGRLGAVTSAQRGADILEIQKKAS